MSEVKWIKMATDIFDNKKIRMIESMPEGDSMIVIWLKILILAGNVNDNGFVYFTKDIPYTEQMLATLFGRPLTTVQLALSIFEKYEMIEIVDDIICVSNWEKYQNVQGMERIREQTRKRVAKHREKKKLETKSGCNVTVTQSNATDIDIDIDIDKDIDININKNNINTPLPPLEDNVTDEHDYDKHTNLVNVKYVLNQKLYDKWEFIRDNPGLWECIKDWMEYKDEKKPRTSNHYVSLRSITIILNEFVKKSQEYGVDAVVEVVNESIGHTYQGIVWDKINKNNQKGIDWSKVK